jgi:hypothetical protein
MAKAKTLVGLDVHAAKIVAAVLDAESGELRTPVNSPNDRPGRHTRVGRGPPAAPRRYLAAPRRVGVAGRLVGSAC